MNKQRDRDWTIKNTKTGEYAHLHSEEECEERKREWLRTGKATEREIAVHYDPPGICRIMA